MYTLHNGKALHRSVGLQNKRYIRIYMHSLLRECVNFEIKPIDTTHCTHIQNHQVGDHQLFNVVLHCIIIPSKGFSRTTPNHKPVFTDLSAYIIL